MTDVVKPLEDALNIIVQLRRSNRRDAELIKAQEDVEAGLSAFLEIWEKSHLLRAS
jgi:hypothetical protein